MSITVTGESMQVSVLPFQLFNKIEQYSRLSQIVVLHAETEGPSHCVFDAALCRYTVCLNALCNNYVNQY